MILRYRLPFLCVLSRRIHKLLYIFSFFLLFAIFAFTRNVLIFEGTIPIELLHYQTLLNRSRSVSRDCKVPRVDPWDKTILRYYSKVAPLKCNSMQPNVTVLENGILRVASEYQSSVQCRCRTFRHNSGVSDFDVLFDEWEIVDPWSGVSINGEFVEVECYSNGVISTKIYSYHWNQIVRRNESAISKRPFLPSSPERPSVLLFGVDSMSRSNFVRTLPKTYAAMQRMGFLDMLGHVKIGDNTFSNWGAILTGKRTTSTREFPNELPDQWDIYFDDWPLVWKNYSEEGYATYFAEDRPDIGTFNFRGWLCGFKQPPTDHYFRPYWVASFWSLLFRRSSPFCYDAFPAHQLQLNYLKEFVRKYDGVRTFAFHWTQDMSHDYLNQIGVADDDFERFLLDNEKDFSNTIVIVFSDHGNRYDAIRETVVGRLEARLPFLSFRFPQAFISKYPNILEVVKKNSQRLTAQFDLHETLLDIVQGNFEQSQERRSTTNGGPYSLFRKGPEKRECFEAKVPADYCPCFDEFELPVDEARQPALHLLAYVNGLLDEERQQRGEKVIQDGYSCAKLDIEKVEFASVRLPPYLLVKDPQVQQKVVSTGIQLNYRVVFRAKKPSGALIEGVMVNDLSSGIWKPSGEIERNNKYGNTSHCVLSPVLKKVCYCVNL